MCDTITGICTCDSNYSGNDCSKEVLTCLNDCSNHGNCDTETGICSCYFNYFGADCSSVHKINASFEHSTYLLTWSAWNPEAIKALFKPACDGMA